METSSLKAWDVTSGPLTTMAMETSSLKAWVVTSRPLITMDTSSLKTSDVTSGPPVKKTTQSEENFSITISTTTISETSTNTTTKFSSPSEERESDNTLLVAVLVALLVVVVLLALLSLWRRRQKKRTGALTLSGGGGKRDRVVDAWAGPARVPDEEQVILGGSGVDKDTAVPDGEGAGRRPSLTTFFGKRKSHQDSLTLETLEAGSVPSQKGEEEPLMSSEGGTVEVPTSDGPEVSDGNASRSL
ncbi:PREDICTED: leukosialin [Chrysochloris asiatica]|uniref:Leukosialin n=1 Tax=Chrysochloris asiatica TaxID=185453 RepID=A0A9B0U6J5_CHRAS|nr:PREDICTED: leukosialin [Chrysochloris asiatica]